jgi:hypothetical protein
VEGRGRGLIKVLPWNLLGGIEENQENPQQDRRSSGRDFGNIDAKFIIILLTNSRFTY